MIFIANYIFNKDMEINNIISFQSMESESLFTGSYLLYAETRYSNEDLEKEIKSLSLISVDFTKSIKNLLFIFMMQISI